MDISPLNGAEWAGQTTTYTGTAGTLTGWKRSGEGPHGVIVNVTTDAYVRVGNGVTATSADYFHPAYETRTYRINDRGPSFTVSAIQVSAGGSVYAKPVGGA